MLHLIQDYVTRQAAQHPERAAINWKNQCVTYGELDSLTNRLAELLRESGTNPGDRIAFCIPKSPAAIVSMIATLKADCVYVPFDSDCPPARVAKVLDACRPKWLLGARQTARLIDQVIGENDISGVRVGCLDEELISGNNFTAEFQFSDLEQFSDQPHAYVNSSSDAAHILFTSGSTGVPKGVIITHEMVTAFVEWGVDYFEITADDRVSGHAPLHFDLSTFDIYGAFAAGAELFPVPPELNLLPHRLAGFIRDNELTQWFSVPSILNYLAKFDAVPEGDFPSLKRLMWCGEVLPVPTLIYLMQRLPGIPFTNLYGPTEATIASSYFTVPFCPRNETEQIPIGVPCEGEDLLVLDDQLQPVSVGEIGDLFIAGVGLSPGYWEDEEKTESIFLTHPTTGDRIYRTGDLAREGEDGLVYFVGRADTQIKSRGYRIELGEIETGLAALPFLGESAVVAIDTDGFENKLICCAFVPTDGADTDVRHIRKELAAHVPKYMIPTLWKSFDQLPKNANGKIDRPELRRQFTEQHQQQSAPASAETDVAATPAAIN
jgi:amino acid adenylation domain-containing protein